MEIGKIADGVVMVALLADQPRTGKIREAVKQETADIMRQTMLTNHLDGRPYSHADKCKVARGTLTQVRNLKV